MRLIPSHKSTDIHAILAQQDSTRGLVALSFPENKDFEVNETDSHTQRSNGKGRQRPLFRSEILASFRLNPCSLERIEPRVEQYKYSGLQLGVRTTS
jgi:hypothetical protein